MPPRGSVAASVQAAVPQCMVAAALHHVPARELGDLNHPIESDVLICSDHPSAIQVTSDIVAKIPNMRPLNAGELAMATPIESFTAVLMQLNTHYKTRVALKLTGIREGDAAGAAEAPDAKPRRASTRRDSRRSPRRAHAAPLHGAGRGHPVRTGPGGDDVHVRHHALRRHPPGPCRHLPHLRRAAAPAARPWSRDAAACATSPTSTTTSCARPASSASTTSIWPPPRPPVSTTTCGPSDVLPVWSEPRATSAIPDIRGFIGMVLDRGHAYEAGGGVYFDVSSFERFGQVSHLGRDEMLRLAAERGGNVDDPHKRDPLDFVLWQPSAPDEPSWESLWGPGRPGWHIECSALALRELGTTIDLHGGGCDLIFPHHECEAAQSEAATGEPFVRHWMHQAMVRMDGEKMSKSLGNLVFVSELRKAWDSRAIRLAVLAHHYRHEWDWDDDVMPDATHRLKRWQAAWAVREPGPLSRCSRPCARRSTTTWIRRAPCGCSTRRPTPAGGSRREPH